MSEAAKKKTPQEETLKDKLTRKPIPHAYALIEDPDHPGMYYPVHLQGVFSEGLEVIGFNNGSSYRERGLARIRLDIQNRHRIGKGWDE